MESLTLRKKNWFADFYLARLFLIDLFRLYVFKSNNELDRYNLLFSVAIAANPKVILELGTGPGVSSLAFIRALQYYRKCGRNQGVFHTCDIDPLTVHRLKRFVRFGSLVVPHTMSTDDLALEWAKHATPIDLLHIDAYHSYEQSLADFEHFAPFVVPNGLILMHDTFPLSEMHEQVQFSGSVWKTAQNIKQNYTDEFEIMTLPYLCGVSFLRKKGAKYF